MLHLCVERAPSMGLLPLGLAPRAQGKMLPRGMGRSLDNKPLSKPGRRHLFRMETYSSNEETPWPGLFEYLPVMHKRPYSWTSDPFQNDPGLGPAVEQEIKG